MASQKKPDFTTWGIRLATGVKDAILDLILNERNYSPRDILAMLEAIDDKYAKENEGVRKFETLPSQSVIERGVRLWRGRTAGWGDEEWRAENEESPQDARIILDVFGAVLDEWLNEGAHPPSPVLMTNRHAEWYLLAAKLAPGLQPFAQGLLARLLQIRDLGNLDPDPLHVLLAMAPWKSSTAYFKYNEAVDDGKLPAVPQDNQLMLKIGLDLHAHLIPDSASRTEVNE